MRATIDLKALAGTAAAGPELEAEIRANAAASPPA